jgi:hypothetical protein
MKENQTFTMKYKRQDDEEPLAISDWGWRYHHIGIPTNVPMNGERYLPQFKFYVSGFETSPFGIEWMRFEPDSQIDEMVKKIPHIAFVVDDLEKELKKREFEILIPPNSPVKGTSVAMIRHNGAPIELIEFEKSKYYN